MNRFTALLLIALLSFILVLLITNPDLFNDIYLYLIGLAGVIVKALQGFRDSIAKAISGDRQEESPVEATPESTKPSPNQATVQSTKQPQTNFYQSDAVG